MKKNLLFYFIILAMIPTLFVFSGCDPDTDSEYPIWFNEYSGEVLSDLKLAQDTFNCFGNVIGSNVVILGMDTPPPDINYNEDETGKYFMVTFERKDKEDLVDITDVQPFRDAVIAKGFILDDDPSSPTHNYYIKDNIQICIYVMGDHFEFCVEQLY